MNIFFGKKILKNVIIPKKPVGVANVQVLCVDAHAIKKRGVLMAIDEKVPDGKPDIAFWFDDDIKQFRFEYSEKCKIQWLMYAYFELMETIMFSNGKD